MQSRKAKVFVPVFGLKIKQPSFMIGKVEFEPKNECPEINKFESGIGYSKEDLLNIHTIAITDADGDDIYDDMINQKAEEKVNQSLNILRTFTYPILIELFRPQIGIMGIYYTEVKKDSRIISSGVDSRKLIKIPSNSLYLELDEYIIKKNFFENGFYKLNKFLTKTPSKFERKLIKGAEWIGEATKIDTLESQFLKFAFSIDAMIGEESPNIPDKGLTARIAERAAFLLSNKGKERYKIYDDMKQLIEKRNQLVHGSDIQIKLWETQRLHLYAYNILKKLLLEIEPNIENNLTEWVLKKSFQN